MYLEGDDAPKKPAKAWPWLTLAARRGDSAAAVRVAKIETNLTKSELEEAKQTLPLLEQELKTVGSAQLLLP
jgi:TPR repeat protein